MIGPCIIYGENCRLSVVNFSWRLIMFLSLVFFFGQANNHLDKPQSQISLVCCLPHVLDIKPCVSFTRARLVNYIKTSEVFRQPYPLQIKSSGPHRYFMNRETWGWTDFLMNPMVNMKAKLKTFLNQYNTVWRALICSRDQIYLLSLSYR